MAAISYINKNVTPSDIDTAYREVYAMLRELSQQVRKEKDEAIDSPNPMETLPQGPAGMERNKKELFIEYAVSIKLSQASS
jgi:hypothetical protein